MKGISLLQPWASLIVSGSKKIETRSWKTSYRGPILIHASKSFPKHAREFADEAVEKAWCTDSFPLGVVIARANLVDCRPTEDLLQVIGDVEKMLGDYSPYRYGFVLEDVEPISPPIVYSGSLGLWNVPEKLMERM